MNEEIEKPVSGKNDADEDEISLIDLFAVFWRRKVMIIVITILAAIGGVIYQLIAISLPPEESYLPNLYTAEAIMLIDNKSSSGGLSSSLGSLGGLASLAGISLSSGQSSYSQLAVFLVSTNTFLDALVEEFDIIRKKKIETNPKTSSRGIFKTDLKAVHNKESGTLSIKFKHIDPVFAKDVVNFTVAYLEKRFLEFGFDKDKLEKENLELNIANIYNEILQLEEETKILEQSVAYGSYRFPSITTEMKRIELELEAKKQIYIEMKVQYELIKIKIASESPIFQVLEFAEVPEKKSEPDRGRLCIIVMLAGGFLSIFLAFALNAISNIRKDPQVIAKLKGTYEK